MEAGPPPALTERFFAAVAQQLHDRSGVRAQARRADRIVPDRWQVGR